MELVIDIGNTRIKAAYFSDGKIREKLESDDPAAFAEFCTHHPVEAAIVSSVREEGPEISISPSARLIFFSHENQLPFINKYKTPETLGADRMAAVAGAVHLFPGENVLVIDAGTCITYDFVSDRKEYSGGAISPGINMRFKALNAFTGKLPLVEPGKATLTGGTTQASILSGVMNGSVMEMEGMIRSYQDLYHKLKIVLTGGDAPLFAKQLKSPIFAAPDLVLTGLHQVLIQNVQ